MRSPPARLLYAYAFAEGEAIARGEGRRAARSARLRRWRFGLLAYAGVFQRAASFLGLQNIKRAFAGAAPVPPDLLKWYMAIGIDLLEAYGMTETTGTCTASRRRAASGSAMPAQGRAASKRGSEPADEILMRGPNVFAGYWQMPDKTAEAIEGEAGCTPAIAARSRRRLPAHHRSTQGHHHHFRRQEYHAERRSRIC